MLTVSKEELAQMVAKMVQNHAQAVQKQKEGEGDAPAKQGAAPTPEEVPKGKEGLNKMAGAKVTWKEAEQQRKG